MAEDVERYLTNQPIQARPPSVFYQFHKLVARHKAPFALLAMLFVMLFGFAITMATQSARIARERDKAIAAERVAAEQRDEAERARNAERDQRNAAEQARNAERNQRNAPEQARNAERDQRNAAERARNAEQGQRLLAEANLKRAEEQRMRAEQQELSNRRLLYAAHMNLAGQAWEAADIVRMQELVDSYWPKLGQEDLRSYEWYYFWRLCHSGLVTLHHSEGVRSVAFSPDGKRLATGSYGRTAKLWDIASGQELLTFKGHGSWVASVAFSPDGKRLATGSYDHTVKLWDVTSGQGLLTLKGHSKLVRSVAFSPDGKKLATGSYDGTVKLWRAATEQEVLARNKR